MSLPTEGDEHEWWALAATYATGVDRRDVDRLVSVFAENAELVVYMGGPGSAPSGTRRGWAEIGLLPEQLERFASTFHQLGQSRFWTENGEGRGEVYCTASHFTDQETMVMYVRYFDQYVRGAAGRWVISRREVIVDWVDHHGRRGTVHPPAARSRARGGDTKRQR